MIRLPLSDKRAFPGLGESSKLWSLWDMIKIWARSLAQLAADLDRIAFYQRPPGESETDALSPEHHDYTQKMLTKAQTFCDQLGMRVSAGVIAKSREALIPPSSSYAKARTEFEHLERCVAEELRPMWLLYLAPEEAACFEHGETPWGELVATTFPEEVQFDIREACRCLGLARHTAAVFHLMRVAEHGLRMLARKAKVRVKKAPLDWAEWRQLIDAIRTKKIEPLFQKRRGKQREEEIEFYRGILGEFEAFKDAYRNQVSHSRSRYDYHQAASVMGHVSEFMGRLARKLAPNAPSVAAALPSVSAPPPSVP